MRRGWQLISLYSVHGQRKETKVSILRMCIGRQLINPLFCACADAMFGAVEQPCRDEGPG